MAIAKVVYKENASATPEVWMDTTQKTVTAGTMLSGTTALKNDGTGITGNIASKSSSDLTASGATVTAPAGYYPNAASKSVASGNAGTPTATKGTVSNHSISVTPSVTNTTGYITGDTLTGTAVTVSASELVSGTKSITASGTTDVTNYASASVAEGSATTPTTSITANPTISVSSGGLITASVSESKSVTPTVSAGYVSSGTAGTVSVSGSNTQQLSTKAAATITPSTTSQTAVAAGKYTTGAVTVAAMPSGTAGTPTATKGTVSNHSVSITPSVTNTTGYITGGTKNGTAVTVNVAELESGTKTITENGTGISVSGYSAVDVAVPSSGSSYSLLHSEEIEVSTTSTSATTEKTITLPVADYNSKMFFITVTDKAGPRSGYFYKSVIIWDSTSAGDTANSYRLGSQVIWCNSSGKVEATSTSQYGVWCYIYIFNGDSTKFYVKSRYNSSYSGTIDGTYLVEIYGLSWPDNENPFA